MLTGTFTGSQLMRSGGLRKCSNGCGRWGIPGQRHNHDGLNVRGHCWACRIHYRKGPRRWALQVRHWEARALAFVYPGVDFYEYFRHSWDRCLEARLLDCSGTPRQFRLAKKAGDMAWRSAWGKRPKKRSLSEIREFWDYPYQDVLFVPWKKAGVSDG